MVKEGKEDKLFILKVIFSLGIEKNNREILFM